MVDWDVCEVFGPEGFQGAVKRLHADCLLVAGWKCAARRRGEEAAGCTLATRHCSRLIGLGAAVS